jgi:hypothetical protein
MHHDTSNVGGNQRIGEHDHGFGISRIGHRHQHQRRAAT